MPLWDKEENLLTKVIVCAAVGLLVGLGMCGLAVSTGAGESRIAGYVAIAGSVAFLLSAAILLISVLVLFVRSVFRIFQRQKR